MLNGLGLRGTRPPRPHTVPDEPLAADARYGRWHGGLANLWIEGEEGW